MERGGVRAGALAAALLAGLAVSSAVRAEDAAIVFQVDGVRDNAGHVRVDLCTEATFLKTDCPYKGEAPAVKGVTTVRVENVPPGAYAAQIYHDRNDNQQVDQMKVVGIPLEEVGFTNDAPTGLHGPKWDKAKVLHDTAEQTLSVTLKKYL